MRPILFLLMLMTAASVAAQPVVTSSMPDTVAVSIFRDPDRAEGGAIDRNWLNGFALISETRTMNLPAGEAVLRFEGVAEGMIAVSAIVTGLPGGVVQKNRDAALLSPASLIDGSLGNRVHIRRTDPATGQVREEEAIIRSGSKGAVVLQTAAGFEALRCTGMPEALVYDAVPPGLSAKPTLSVTTRSAAEARVTVTLTYLATGFDWASNYVARVEDDGTALDLFAWLTIANSNGESFADASLSVLAGSISKVSDYDALADRPEAPRLHLRCFATGSGRGGSGAVPPPPPPPPAPSPPPMMAMDMVVTASRVGGALMEKAAVVAVQENLGDLKLYRVPVPVTVAANGQKQVALLIKDAVPFQTIYRLRTDPATEQAAMATERVLRMQNKPANGLGVPLPSGQVAVFEPRGAASLLVGEGRMRDHAVGEKVDLVIGESAQVRVDMADVTPGDARRDYRVTVSNANPFAVNFELGFAVEDSKRLDPRLRKLPRRDGLLTWAVRVPANGTQEFAYQLKAD